MIIPLIRSPLCVQMAKQILLELKKGSNEEKCNTIFTFLTKEYGFRSKKNTNSICSRTHLLEQLLQLLTLLMLLDSSAQFHYLKKTHLSLGLDDKDVDVKNEGLVKLVPFHALVVHDRSFCSGALITSRIVMTVATCCLTSNRSQILVKLGSDSTSSDGQVINVIDVKMHEYHRHRSALDNDIALLVLAHHALFGQRVMKILLSNPDAALEDNSIFYVSNFDQKSNFSKATHDLQITEMITYSQEKCQRKYDRIITPALFCGVYRNFRTNIMGDIGGSALFDKYAVGLTVYMGNKADKNPIAVFTNVSYFYRWIKLNTVRLLKKHCIDEDEKPIGRSESDQT